MSIFGDIAKAIFGTGTASATEAQPGTGTTTAAKPSAAPASGGTATGTATMSKVDVAAILDQKAKTAGEKLEWRKSIVDLMKLLGLDSSIKARKALAEELKYTGDKNDSAEMNIWLHKQVMTKLAANGGIVPKDLQD